MRFESARVAGLSEEKIQEVKDGYEEVLDEKITAALLLTDQIIGASRPLEKKNTVLIKRNLTREERAEILNTLSEQISRYVVETDPNKPGADGAIVAEMASALGQLDPDFRNSILRAAGNPEIFRPLQDVQLPDIPKGELGDESNKVLQQAEGISRTVGTKEEPNEFMPAEGTASADQAPMSGRPSSVMVDPAYYRKNRKTGEKRSLDFEAACALLASPPPSDPPSASPAAQDKA